jgi:hypothetical protein
MREFRTSGSVGASGSNPRGDPTNLGNLRRRLALPAAVALVAADIDAAKQRDLDRHRSLNCLSCTDSGNSSCRLIDSERPYYRNVHA